MENRIINSLMKNFAKSNELSTTNESALFEEFSTYYVVSKLMDGDFSYDNIDEMQIGDGDDAGIDAIGLLVNGEFIDNLQSLKDLLANGHRNLDALVLFIQSKTSSKFQYTEMINFGNGIADTLREEPRLRQNINLKEKWAMINELVNSAANFKSIRGRAYYVTTGEWTEDHNLVAAISNVKETIMAQHVFTDFEYKPIDHATLRQYNADAETKVSGTVYFPEKADLPDVLGVDQGWYGYISETEFLSLIVDENGDLRRSLFYDNVRDFQGDTPANIGIQKTLMSNHPENMAILNNGITIIAEHATQTRKKLTLENYQIVNGCQTSYVIYNNRKNARETIFLPIKIIVTTDVSVSTNITVANNRQTTVKDEDLLALTEVQKELEEFFKTYTGDKALFYERRSNQYSEHPEVEKVRIVPISMSLRTYSSMFMGVPQLASRWIGKLYKGYSKQVFDGEKTNLAFYTAAFTWYRFNFFIRNGIFERKYAKFKYFILIMLRLYLTGETRPEISKKKTINECETINEVIWNKDKCKEYMKKMIDVIAKIAGDQITSNTLTSSKTFLDEVLQGVLDLKKQEGINN
ncbi:AIPR family protein [Secundilactobacillus muriivasis]